MYMYVHVCMYICMYVYVRTCMYVHMYVQYKAKKRRRTEE